MRHSKAYLYTTSALGLLALLFVVASFFISIGRFNARSYAVLDFDENWTVDVNGETETGQRLSRYGFKKTLEKGDVITITNTLPMEVGEDSAVRMLSYLTTVEAYVDGMPVYTYGLERYEDGGFVGSGYHFILLPAYSAGRELQIILRPNEHAAFTNIPAMEIMADSYVHSEYISRNVLSVFSSVFLFVIGIALTILGLVARTQDDVFRRLVPIGVFSLCMGTWTMCSIKFIQMFSTQLEFNTALEYMALYVALLPLMILILMMREDAVKWKRSVLKAMCLLLLLFDVATIILHASNRYHISVFVTWFHILALLCVVVVIMVGMRRPKDMPPEEKVLTIGLIEMIVFGVLDVARFNVQKYLFPEMDWLSTSVLPIGTMIFIILLIISYLIYMYNIGMDKTEKETLTRMAYQDPMTGLFNRAKCDEMFARFDSRRDAECTLILCDLNGLKKTNDTYGHEAGDLLISTFSQILRIAFDGHGTLIRMGGDEFLIMINHRKNESHLKSCLLKMIQLEKEVSKKHPFPIECSYGVAFSTEVKEHKADKIYMLADERMYKMKMKSKHKRVD